MSSPVLVWFRNDLRLSDNPALTAALNADVPLIPVYILDEEPAGKWARGGASRWWLHHSLASLSEALEKRGSKLILSEGPTEESLQAIAEDAGAKEVFCNARIEPYARKQEKSVRDHLADYDIEFHLYRDSMLHDPREIETKEGNPYQVFTPFWKSVKAELGNELRTEPDAPKKLPSPKSWPKSESLDDWKLLPKLDWDEQFYDHWTPGRKGAEKKLTEFLENAISDYGKDRDFPAKRGTSQLSPHLHFGEITPREIWNKVNEHGGGKGAEKYLSEVGWREFAHHLLYHFPHTINEPLREKYADFPWRDEPEELDAWKKGKTGYPIIDAGMRELWATGWMHNRVRMIVSSFLTKDLMIHWMEGDRWFWDTLVDADLANNTLGWQWAAGCGADAAPYFRIFNPMTQSKKFDSKGEYLRRWLPELADLSDEAIHEPWTASESELAEAGVKLGEDYPERIVDHAEARERALAALETIKD
ncbi:cryptochrome/photolyase family protein [Calycomorphotria hydatis]|uniref:Deoxyribodipyrimidine photo-lyase n=1 Tax=Calycomorphotria hydatis TaxID=2528027 RepID=A0A517T6I7_9PLAN|nr:deoxyribodipyrimidine photo-lyase [Calycomorphotria hydatis]QDT63992.1 Deoxyribodipyrimidine photo-lyase [Calycomorphotria hydatis]